MGILIKNGTIVTALNEYKADIRVEGEKIAAIGQDLDAAGNEIVDAEGMYILPGGVDQHTHFSFQYGDAIVKGFETSNAALVGGTTTVIDFVNQEAGRGIAETVKKYNEQKVSGVAMVDYSFHGVVTDPSDILFEEIPKLPDYGIPTIKLFMAYKGFPYHSDDSAVFKALQASKEAGVTIMVHAENADIIDELQKQCIAQGHVEPKYHAVSRPPLAEAEATQRAIYLAAAAEAPIYIVHVTCKEAMEAVRDSYIKGAAVYGETCTHYLVLGEENLAKPDFEGAKYVCSPPLRTQQHQDALWEAVRKGWLTAVSSDHCGFDWKTHKHMGKDDFTKIPNGAPSLENRLAVLWTYGVETGKISRQKLVEIFATNPAKINGIFHRKGHIGVGYDADLVIFDPTWKGIMTVEGSLQGVDYCAFEGMEQKGRPDRVYLRGKLTVEKGKFVGQKGQGTFIKGTPFGLCYENFK